MSADTRAAVTPASSQEELVAGLRPEAMSWEGPSERPARPGFIMCVCTGKCPGFEKMDIWDFINRVRIELPVQFGIIHPQLCEEDGDRFLADFLQAKRPVVVAGCAPTMQYKLFRDAFTAQDMDVRADMVPVDIRDMTTEEAVGRVAAALQAMGLGEEG